MHVCMYAGPQAEGMTPAQLQDVMAHEMIRMYEKYSDYIHNPGFSVITLRMDLMPPKEAAKQILLCRKFGIAYAMYEIGERIHVPPPEVARILGEEDD